MLDRNAGNDLIVCKKKKKKTSGFLKNVINKMCLPIIYLIYIYLIYIYIYIYKRFGIKYPTMFDMP